MDFCLVFRMMGRNKPEAFPLLDYWVNLVLLKNLNQQFCNISHCPKELRNKNNIYRAFYTLQSTLAFTASLNGQRGS